jgi:hypothetical protein
MNPYTIAQGDTLTGIAGKNNTTVSALMALNPNIKDPNKISAGANLNLGMSPAVGGNTTNNILSPSTNNNSYMRPPGDNGEFVNDWAKDPSLYKGSGNSLPSWVSSSNSIVNSENELKTNVNGMSNVDTSLLDTAHEQAITAFDDQAQALKVQQTQQEAQIQSDFESALANAKTGQEKELATNIVSLARIGGYLGGSASSVGAINTLTAQHRAEQAQLETKKQQALAIARTAISEKQFNLAKEKAAEARQYSTDIENRRNKFFEQTMALTKENREASKYQTEEADRILDKYVDSGTEIPPEALSILSTTLGTSPETLANLVKAKKDSNELDKTSKLYTILEKVPAGQYVSIGGKMYAGLKKEAGSGNGNGDKSSQYSKAEEYVSANTGTKSFDQLNSDLRKLYPNLPDGDITQILKTRYVTPETELDTMYNTYIGLDTTEKQDKYVDKLNDATQKQFNDYVAKKDQELLDAEATKNAGKKWYNPFD